MGAGEGASVGSNEGSHEGRSVGGNEGARVGACVGGTDGRGVGSKLGASKHSTLKLKVPSSAPVAPSTTSQNVPTDRASYVK